MGVATKRGKARSYGFDADRLKRVDGLIADRYIDTGLLPHAQLLIARDGEVVHFSNQGTAREGHKRKVDDGSLFRIASMTKPVTSVAFMMLVEQGLIALDDPVSRILPEFADMGVYHGGGGGVPFVTRRPAEAMRMIDLLRHTAGLTYSFQNRSNVDAAYREGRIERWHGGHDLDGFIGALAAIPLEFAPGTSWNYSVATDVLGTVVERVSGMPLDRFFATRIFDPLKMADTGFAVPEASRDRLTDCYTFSPGKGRVMYDRGEASAWARQPKLLSGGGGLVSSTLDYHRFCLMLLNGGELDGARILGRKTIDLMTCNHLPGGADLASLSKSLFSEAANAGTGFGLGFAVNMDVARSMVPGTAGEYYWGGMFSTAFFVDPVERVTMVFMTQLSPSNLYPIRRELKTMIYAAMT